MPVVGDALLQQIRRQRAECLYADVVHAIKHGGEQSQPHQNHHAFGVERVADVGRFARYRAGCVENRRRSFIEGIPFFMFAARQEVRFDFFQKMFQAHNQPSFSMVSSTLRNSGPYSYLPGQTKLHKARSSSSNSKQPSA